MTRAVDAIEILEMTQNARLAACLVLSPLDAVEFAVRMRRRGKSLTLGIIVLTYLEQDLSLLETVAEGKGREVAEEWRAHLEAASRIISSPRPERTLWYWLTDRKGMRA